MKRIYFLVIFLSSFYLLTAQCTAPSFTVDLSSSTDSTWVLTNTPRSGVCCGSPNCVTFTVFTNPNSQLISFDVTNPSPSGSAYYQVNCGAPVSIGTPLCIVGLASPFTITYCKPGGDHPDYIISAGTIVHGSDDISIQKTNCTDTLFVDNVDASSVTWTSIFPGAQGAYNSYLSCLSGCTSTIVTPGPNPPTYVDFQVSGNPNINCGSFSRDTIRVYFVPNLTGVINPQNPVICASSGTNVTLTAVASGGASPYNYDWSTGPHTQSITVNSAGTYTVTIGDKTKCPKINVTATIGTLPSATFNYGGGSYCKNETNPSPIYTGSGQAGTFSSSPAGLVFVSTSTGQVNLAASAVGTYTVLNTIAASGGCPGTTANSTITINPFPTMTSASSATICSGATVNIPLTSSISSTYTWIASDNTNTTGESLTTQTTSSLNNTITNTSASSQLVTYTVTPTSTLTGSCVGTPQTVSVTVNNMDNASFSYATSTNCQTGANPVPTITGLAGGTFSSTAGLVFVSTSTGTINLSASAVGSYTVTYTTNGVCPNTATFPINITTAPSASFTFNGSPYCNNGANPLPIFGPGASGGTFTSGAGLVFVSASTGEINLAASTPGTYTITNTIPAAGGCATSTGTATITITALPVATFNYSASPYCKNGTNPSPTFTGGGVAGTFTAGAGLSINPSTGLVNLAASIPGTYTVTNTIAAAGGCSSVVATSNITITALPVATFNYPASPYCQNSADPSPAYSGGGYAGTFNASSVFLSLNNSTGAVDLSASQAGTFTVTNSFAAAGGCPAVSATATITITTLPLGSFSFTGTPYCNNGIDPTPELIIGGTNGTYSSSPAGLSLDPNAGTVDLSASTAGNYTVTNTIAAFGGCPAVIETAAITVTALPVAAFNYSSSSYCKNGTNPSPGYPSGGVAGTFSASPAGLVFVSTSSGEVNLSASSAGTYTVTNTIAAASGCPQVVATNTITITNLPVATFSYIGSPYCKNASNPSPTYSGGGVAGTFTSAAGLSINPTTGLVNLSASTAGTYTVTNTIAAGGGCPAVIATATITVTNLPVASFNFISTPFCQNAVNPSPTYVGGGVAGTFSAGGGLIINASNGTINLSSSTPGTYTVTNTIAASNGCPVVTAQSPVTITALPVATFSYQGTPFCQNAVNPSPTYSGGGYAGTFTSGTGLNIASGTGLVNLATSTSGSYTVTNTIAAAAGCPQVTATSTLAITTLPISTFEYSSSPYCQNGTNPTPTFIGGGVAGVFSLPSGLSINTASGAVNLASSSVGTYTVTNTIAASGGCPVVSSTNTIAINPVATANAGSDVTMCSSNSYTLSGSIGGGASSLTWTSNGTGSFNNANAANAIYTPSAGDISNGIVILTLTTNDPTGPCVAVFDAMQININTVPTANAGNDATICEGTSLNVNSSIGGGASSLAWSTSGTGSFNSLTSLTPTYTPSPADVTTGTVTLTLTTNDPAGPCPAVTDALILSITPRDIPTFNFGGATFCQTGIDPIANITGTTGGSFSANPATLVINSGTGAVDLSASPLGTYTITYTTSGACPDNDEVNLTITVAPSAAFSFSGSPYCTSGTDPQPVFPVGSSGGEFTSGGGLTIDPISGNIDLSASTAGTYTITNTIVAAGGCAADIATNVIQIDEAAQINANADQVVCYGTSVNLNGIIGGSTSSVTWSGGAGSFSPNADDINAVYTPVSADSTNGVITLTITSDDPAGVCPAVSDELFISIHQPATAFAGNDISICYGTDLPLTGAIGGSANSAEWSGGNGSFSPNAFDLNATYIPSAADSTAGSVTLNLLTDDPTGVCPAASSSFVLSIGQPATVYANIDQIICYGSSITLNGSIGGSASSSVWTGGAGSFDNDLLLGATYSPNQADSTAGSVTLTLTTNDPAGICPAVNDDVVIVINQPAYVNANIDQDICFGTDISLSGVIGGSASSASWSGGAGTFDDSNLLNATYTPSSADSTTGNVTLTITTDDPNGVCPAVTDNITININQPATINANIDQTICYGSAVDLNASVGGSATSVTWSGGNGSFNNNSSLNAIYTPASIDSTLGIITLTISSDDPAGVCPAVTDNIDIIIEQPATTFANVDQIICYGSAVNLAGSLGGSATSSAWTGGTGSYDDSTSLNAIYIPSAADSTAGVITLTLTTNDPAGVCNAVSDDLIITINQPATVNANSDQDICYGTVVNLNGTFGGSSTSITWTGGSGNFVPDANTTNATYTPSSLDSTSGTVTLVITTDDPAGVCPALVDSMILTINQPAVANASIDQTICFGDTVSLTGLIFGSASSSIWSGGTGNFTPSVDSLSVNYIPTSVDSTAGSVTLTITTNDPAGVCPAVSDDVVITINQPASVNANIDQIICYGSTVALSGSIGGSATSATWSGGTGSFASLTSLNTIYAPSAADSAAGIISIYLTTNDPAGVCQAVVDEMILNINQPATAFAGLDDMICEGSDYTLTGLYGAGASSLTWTTGGSGTFSNNTSLNAIYTPSAADISAGSVTITITTDEPVGPCPSVSDQMVLTINPAATVSASNDTSVCANVNLSVNSQYGGGASGVNWTTTGSGTFNNASITNPVYTPSANDLSTGSVILTVTTNDPAGQCGAVSDQLTINYSSMDNASFNYPATVLCQVPGTITPTVTGLAGGVFTSSTPGLILNVNTGEVDQQASTPGNYMITYTTTGACPNFSSTTISINSLPNASAGVDATMACSDTILQLNGSSSTIGVMYSWSDLTGNIVGNTDSSSAFVSSAGIYVITVTDANSCVATDTVVVLQGTIDASFTADQLSGHAPLNVNFTNNSIGATDYLWNFGNGNTSTSINASTEYTEGGSYQVILTAYAGNCVDSDTLTIFVEEDISIEIPNVFTPNNDGINDYFYVKSTGLNELEGMIYNRWGILVFSFQGVNSSWDGKNSADIDSADGTYFVILKAVGYDHKVYEKQAYILLAR